MINKLQYNPDNPRLIKKDGFERLKKKIKEFPEMLEKRPIVYDENYIVLGGNQRLRVLKELAKDGLEIKDTYFQSAKGWTNEQKRKFVILDNIADGEWEWETLANKWDDLPLEEWGLDPTEWRTDEIEEDEPPEVEEGESDSKLGKVYKLGRHRLMCGDATKIEDVEKLMNGKKINTLFTDPPYGELKIFQGGERLGSSDGLAKKRIFEPYPGEGDFRIEPVLKAIGGIPKKCIIWGGNYFVLPIRTSWLCWDKTAGGHSYFSDFELAWTNLGVPARIFNHSWAGMIRAGKKTEMVHPTQKPVELAAWQIKEFTDEDEIVVDLFGGSGWMLIACEQTNRTCYMMELDPKYCDVIRKRYAKFIDKEDEWQKITQKA